MVTARVTTTAAVAFLVGSATLAAITVWLPSCAGAVYKPEELIVPTVEFPPLTVSTDHVTAVLLEPVMVAENWYAAVGARLIDD